MRYVFVTPEGITRQVISGSLSRAQVSQFERDYAILFGTTSVVEVGDESVFVWIGGTYTPDEGFLPPPPPPEPEIVEGEDEEIIEEIVEETTNDDAPIE
jgi:hypothetical protein